MAYGHLNVPGVSGYDMEQLKTLINSKAPGTDITRLEELINGKESGKRFARFVVGTSTAGWTAEDCDYLCDGTEDDVEIEAAIAALPATGGTVLILDGNYNINNCIGINKPNAVVSGCGGTIFTNTMTGYSATMFSLNASNTAVTRITAYCNNIASFVSDSSGDGTVSFCTIYDARYGFSYPCGENKTILITNNILTRTLGYTEKSGMGCMSYHHCVFSNNIVIGYELGFDNNGSMGVCMNNLFLDCTEAIATRSWNTIILCNTCLDCQTGIHVNSWSSFIVGNYIDTYAKNTTCTNAILIDEGVDKSVIVNNAHGKPITNNSTKTHNTIENNYGV